MCRPVQTGDVLLELEHFAGINPDSLKDPISIEQAMIVYGDLGILLWDKFTVQINDAAHPHPPETLYMKYIIKPLRSQHAILPVRGAVSP